MVKKLSMLVVGAAVAGLGTSAMAATSAVLDTGVAPWTVDGNPAVVVNPVPSAWTNAVAADWISVAENPRQPGGVNYTFELLLTLDPGSYLFDLTFSTDNRAVDILINGVSVGGNPNIFDPPQGIPGEPIDYEFTFDLDDTVTDPVSLTFVVYNENATSRTNPLGLVVAGTATIVPVPGAGLMGLTALGAMGLLARRRRQVA